MSDGTLEQPAQRDRAFWIRISVGILGLLCAANVFALVFIVPKFVEIYADVMPGGALPRVTQFFMMERTLLVFFTLAITVPALAVFWRQRPYAIVWINVGIIWFFVQGGVTVYALGLPLTRTPDIVGMPDTP